jgi:uncharacterized protein YjiS (DUF1127 family)
MTPLVVGAMQPQILCSAAKACAGVPVMSIINLIFSAGRAFSEWRRRDRAYAQLMTLDDHSLADIGIHRSQIAGLVEGVQMPGSSSVPVLSYPTRGQPARRKEA